MATEELSLKSLQSHLIKTVIGSVVSALIAGLIMGYSFYWQTKSSIERLTDEQKETKVLVDKHSEQLSKNNQDNSVSDVQIKNLERRMTSIENTQKDMLSVLIEINMSQKILVKNTK